MSNNKKWWSKWIREALQIKQPAPKRRRKGRRADVPDLRVEELEPRLAPAVNLTYGEITTTPPLTVTGITGYLADVLSTNFTLRVEQDGGNFFWRLYGTGLLPNNPIPISPLTLVEEVQITSAAATTSSVRGGIGDSRSSPASCSTSAATSEMWMKFSPYVRISRSSTSQMILRPTSHAVRLIQRDAP